VDAAEILTVAFAGLAVVNLTAQAVVAHHRPAGWLGSICAQVCWSIYAIRHGNTES
jgi:hypothetical protein